MGLVYTDSFDNCKKGNLYSIDKENNKDFNGEIYKKLCSQEETELILERMTTKNIKKNILQAYILSYFENTLAKLDPGIVLDELGKDPILLCNNKKELLSHRDIVAAWFELYYNFKVPVVKVNENGELITIKRNKLYSFIKATLEVIIKENINMRGFNCIASSYLVELTEDVDKVPDILQYIPINGDSYRQMAEVFQKLYKEKIH